MWMWMLGCEGCMHTATPKRSKENRLYTHSHPNSPGNFLHDFSHWQSTHTTRVKRHVSQNTKQKMVQKTARIRWLGSECERISAAWNSPTPSVIRNRGYPPLPHLKRYFNASFHSVDKSIRVYMNMPRVSAYASPVIQCLLLCVHPHLYSYALFTLGVWVAQIPYQYTCMLCLVEECPSELFFEHHGSIRRK